MKTAKTVVVFRTFLRRKLFSPSVIALFPEVPYSLDGRLCSSYQQIGQHGAASPRLPESTRPATPAEIAPLKRELEQIGYRLKVRRRVTRAMDLRRTLAAAQNILSK